jgi:dihydrofolate synthase/folylpolyglutamate synthase
MPYTNTLKKTYDLSSRGILLGLDRVDKAARALGSPQESLTVAQIAGTNGKGSVACLIDHAARSAGLTAGLFTSPHLHRFSQRIMINGREVATEPLGEALDCVLALTEGPGGIPLTFFEVATLAALEMFARANVDLAVMEVGLGGRLDATSITNPSVCALTSIGMDHTAVLGNTIRQIAAEKASIARPGVPLFCGPLTGDALDEVVRVASERRAPLHVCGRNFFVSEDLRVPWPGRHQRENAALAAAVFTQLGLDDHRMSRSAFVDALPSALWPGRFEILEGKPRFILDSAHNTEAVDALLDALSERNECPDVVIFGAASDKPVDAMFDRLSSICTRMILAPPPIPRAFDHEAFAKKWNTAAAPDVGAALKMANDTGGATVLVTGSLFTVGEARRLLLGEHCDPPIRM